MFLGFVEVDAGTLVAPVLAKTSGQVPINLDALPGYRIYGPDGLMTGGTGTASFGNSGAITDATNAGPIVITSVDHGLTTGTRVTITGVLGNTNANGTYVVTVVDSSTFSLQGSTGNDGYISGGTWNVTGFYTETVSPASSAGFVSGTTYSILTSGLLSSAGWANLDTFTVV
jgi:hypothetical protein